MCFFKHIKNEQILNIYLKSEIQNFTEISKGMAYLAVKNIKLTFFFVYHRLISRKIHTL